VRGSLLYPLYMAREEPYNSERARKLRHEESPPEGVLWSHLRGRRLGGLKFRRQHPIGPIVVDFCCAEAMLVVELDSSYHRGRKDEDAERDSLLRERGYEVLRVTASELAKDQNAVLSWILRVAKTRKKER